MMSTPVETFELWKETKKGRVRLPAFCGYTSEARMFLGQKAAAFNAEEQRNAHMERRAVRARFFVVRATTTYEED